MPDIRIFLSVNQLPRTGDSLEAILTRLRSSAIRHCPVTIIHSRDWRTGNDFRDLDVAFVNSGQTAAAYEFPAIRHLWQDSQQADFLGLYLHVKGASSETDQQWQNGRAWQDYMLQGVVDAADQCVGHLEAGADLVGSQWHWHWKGNYWWFQSRYVRQLVDPFLMDQDYRNNCEHWCSYSYWWGRYPLPRIKNLFYLPINSDTDYRSLADQGYRPQWDQQMVYEGSVEKLASSGWYGAYDILRLSAGDIANGRNIIARYVNYDGVIVNRDTGEQHEASGFLY